MENLNYFVLFQEVKSFSGKHYLDDDCLYECNDACQ